MQPEGRRAKRDLSRRASTLGLQVDSIVVKPVNSTPVVDPDAKEIIINPGFETGKLKPWYIDDNRLHPHGAANIISPGINSTYALQTRYLCDTFDDYYVSLSQNLTGFVLDATYIIAFDYNATGSIDYSVGFSNSDHSISRYFGSNEDPFCFGRTPCSGHYEHAMFAAIEAPVFTIGVSGCDRITFDNISIKRAVVS